MSVQDYMSALKLGKKEYHACVYKGKFPYLPVMENIIDDKEIANEVDSSADMQEETVGEDKGSDLKEVVD